MTREQFRTATQRLTARLTGSRERLASLGGHRDLARYLGHGEELRRRWASMTLDQRRAVIRSLVEAVVIGPAVRGARVFDADRAELRWRV